MRHILASIWRCQCSGFWPFLQVCSGIYSWTLNNMGLNRSGPLIYGCFDLNILENFLKFFFWQFAKTFFSSFFVEMQYRYIYINQQFVLSIRLWVYRRLWVVKFGGVRSSMWTLNCMGLSALTPALFKGQLYCCNLRFPEPYDVEHLFILLFAVSMTLVRCLLRSLAHF